MPGVTLTRLPRTPMGGVGTLVSERYGNVCERAVATSNRPSLDLSPWHPEANPEGERGTGPVSSLNPNSCMGARARTSKEGSGRMPQQGRTVGIDVSKLKADACIRSLQLWLSKPSTPDGEQELIAWLRENGVGLAVMEASGGYERSWGRRCARRGLRCASWIPSGCATSPNRPDGWPRTIRSTPR